MSCHGERDNHVNKPSDAKVRPEPDRLFGRKAGASRASTQNPACLTCHQGGNRISWQTSTHANRDVACASCHQVHASHDKVRDKYGHDALRPYGLRDGTAMLFSVDATLTITDAWQLTAWFSHDKTKATQVGQRATNGGAIAAEKEAHLEDTGTALGLGLRGKPSEKFRIGADVPAGSLADGTTVMTYPRRIANFLGIRYTLRLQ